MTDIREGLAELVDQMNRFFSSSVKSLPDKCNNPKCAELDPPDCEYCWADEILTYLHENGVVQKVEGELPEDPFPHEWDEAHDGYSHALHDMLKAGYTLTKEIV